MHIPVIIMVVLAAVMVACLIGIDLWMSRGGGKNETDTKSSEQDKS